MTEAETSRIVRASSELLKKGLLRFFNPDEDDPSRLQSWIRQKTASIREVPKAALATALEDQEVQEMGQEYIATTIQEAVKGVKENFDPALQTLKSELAPSTPDTRNNYERIRDLLNNEDDPWYTKIMKNAVARVFSWSVPIVSYVSAAVASRTSGKESADDIQGYRAGFQEIYGNLLSKFSPQEATTTA